MNILKNLLIFLIPITSYGDQQNTDLGGISSFLLFPLLFVLMYFLLIRPQTKKANEHKNLISNLKLNDEVVTQGGIIGKITKITDEFIILSLNTNIEILIKKEFIINLLPKGTMKQSK